MGIAFGRKRCAHQPNGGEIKKHARCGACCACFLSRLREKACVDRVVPFLAIALLASLTFSSAVDAPAPRTLSFDSMHLQSVQDGVTPAGLAPEDAGTILLGENPIEGRHGIGMCFGVFTRASQVVVSYDQLCGVCGDARLKYAWTTIPSKDYEAQERLSASCGTDLLVVAADPAFGEAAATIDGSFRTSLKAYFNALAADGIAARWVPLSDLRSQEALGFSWPAGGGGAITRTVAGAKPSQVLLVGDFPAGTIEQARAANPAIVFARLPLSVDAAGAYLSRAAQVRNSLAGADAKPYVVEYCAEGDAACKSKAKSLAALAGISCPSINCLSSLPQESFAGFVSRLQPGRRLFLISPPERLAAAGYRNAVLFADSSFPAARALESGALVAVAPRGLGFDWWTPGANGGAETAGFTGADVAMVYSAGGKPALEAVASAMSSTALFYSPTGSVQVGGERLRQERSTLSRTLSLSELDYFGDPTLGLDGAGMARLRPG